MEGFTEWYRMLDVAEKKDSFFISDMQIKIDHIRLTITKNKPITSIF